MLGGGEAKSEVREVDAESEGKLAHHSAFEEETEASRSSS